MSSLFGQPSGGAPSIFSQPNNTSAQAPPGTGLFGSANPSTAQNKPNMFGSLSGNTANTSQPPAGGGLFGSTTAQPAQTGGGGLFGSTPQPAQTGGGGLFGSSTSQTQPSGGLFGRVEPAKPAGGGMFGSSTAQPAQQGGGLFGSSTAQPAQQGGGLFGSMQQNPQQQQQGGGLFGALGQSTQQQPQQQQGGGLFGGLGQSMQQQQQPQQQQQLGSGLFGALGQSTQQQPQQQQGGGLFGGLGQSTQQQQQQQLPQQGSVLGQSRLFGDSQIEPRQKSVINQIELAFSKWDPQSPSTLFHTYLYNAVPPDAAPFYGPGPHDDETKWEEALAKKPSPGAIPVAVRGFQQLGIRMMQQVQNLNVLNGRLHEINDGLNVLLQKHDLEVSIRAAECRRRHLKLSRQCLGLAAKTQCLRNRGYAMDGAEEELRKKLLGLEKQVFDPALDGRGEEIWARMVSVRERGRQLQREYERAGRGLGGDNERKGGTVIDEEILKRAMKILEDYHSQLSHLARELEDINRDWAEYTKGRPAALTNGRY